MDYNIIAPIVKETIQQVLSEKIYPFGFKNYKGFSDKVASGKLKNSVTTKIVQNKNNAFIEIFMEDYWKNVQNGRRAFPDRIYRKKKGVKSTGGTSKFLEALEKWIKDRGLTGRDKKGRFITRKSFAFAIKQNINKFGIRRTDFIDKSLERLDADNRIIDALGQQTFDELINNLRGI